MHKIISNMRLFLGMMGLIAANLSATVYDTPSGSSGSNGPLSAEASITAGPGTITVVLYNLETNIRSAGQAVSGITFNVLGLSSRTLGLSSLGETINPSSHSAYTLVNTTDPLSHWTAALSSGKVAITTVPGTSEKPNEMIIGPPNGSNIYSNINRGFTNFDPYVLNSATFTITDPAFTSESVISNVVFNFGTGPDTFVGAMEVPEPTTVSILTLALLGIVLLTYQRSQQRKKTSG